MRRSSYLHPVYAPDGTLLTDDFNPDHPHHRGISWMWPEVSVDGKKGDVWMVKEFQQRFVRWKARETDGPQARLAVENGWFDGERKFVNEDVEIVAHAAADNQRLLEFTLRFEAMDRPVEIVGTSEGKKGFGGFCFRFAPRDGGAEKTVIRTDQGISPEGRRPVAPPVGGDHRDLQGPGRRRPHRRHAVQSRLSEQRLAHAARVRLPERFVSRAPTDHAPAGQAAGAEVSRDTVRGAVALRTLLWSWLR